MRVISVLNGGSFLQIRLRSPPAYVVFFSWDGKVPYFAHSVIRFDWQILTKHLLCARRHTRLRGYAGGQRGNGVHALVGGADQKQANRSSKLGSDK